VLTKRQEGVFVIGRSQEEERPGGEAKRWQDRPQLIFIIQGRTERIIFGGTEESRRGAEGGVKTDDI